LVENIPAGGPRPPRSRRLRENRARPLAAPARQDYLRLRRALPFPCRGSIPVALSNSEGAGSARIVVHVPGAHLYIQVLGNLRTLTVVVVPPIIPRQTPRRSMPPTPCAGIAPVGPSVGPILRERKKRATEVTRSHLAGRDRAGHAT